MLVEECGGEISHGLLVVSEGVGLARTAVSGVDGDAGDAGGGGAGGGD